MIKSIFTANIFLFKYPVGFQEVACAMVGVSYDGAHNETTSISIGSSFNAEAGWLLGDLVRLYISMDSCDVWNSTSMAIQILGKA